MMGGYPLSDFMFMWGLLREGVIASLAAALVLPLVGALLFVRRSALLGIAVPQFSSAGLALGLFLIPWFPKMQQEFLEHGHPPMLYSFAFAAGAAALALSAFSFLSSRFRKYNEAITAVGFSLSLSATVLLLTAAPSGAQLADTLLRGEIILLDVHGMIALLVISGLSLICLFFIWRWLLLVAFDPEGAVALGHSVLSAERWQVLIVGASVGVGVVTIGPMLVFALLFLPPLFGVRGKPGLIPYLTRVVSLSLLSIMASWPISIILDMPFGVSASLTCFTFGSAWLLIKK